MKCHSHTKHSFAQESKLHSIFPSSEVTGKPANGDYELFLNKFLKHFKKITVIY